LYESISTAAFVYFLIRTPRLSGGNKARSKERMDQEHRATAHHRVSLALGQCDTCSESTWSEVQAWSEQENPKDASVQTAPNSLQECEEAEVHTKYKYRRNKYKYKYKIQILKTK
jgi:hypothetical protein